MLVSYAPLASQASPDNSTNFYYHTTSTESEAEERLLERVVAERAGPRGAFFRGPRGRGAALALLARRRVDRTR